MLQPSLTRLALLSFLGAACSGDGAGPTLPPCTAAGFPVSLAVGQYVAFDPTSADSGCAVFPANASPTDSAEYLVVPQLATGVAGATSSYRLLGDTIRPATLAAAAPLQDLAERPPAERFHAFLRLGDQRRSWGFVPEVTPPGGGPALTRSAAAGPPALGSLRQFMVCARLDCSRFDEVIARVRALKTKVAIYVDTTAPAGGLDSLDLDSLATLFDNRLYAVDTAAFGRESDIDTNSVVLVLMTPTVNKLVNNQACQSSGFVAGFFFGADLDPLFRTDPRSNKGEVFYALVADPSGTVSCAHSTTQVKRIVPVTFIHEFQHMISFNQHVLARGGSGEVLWLNEGLSHFAEELGGRTYVPGTAEFSRFTIGNLFNAYKYLDSTKDHFLVPSEGIGSLAERGATWLFVRYLVDRHAGDTTVAAWNAFTRRLLATSLRGDTNIATVTGTPFDSTVTRWALANWVSDLPGFTAAPELQYDSWRLRTTYASLNAQDATNFPKPYPLTPMVSAGRATSLTGTLRAGSGVYHRALLGPGDQGFTLFFFGRSSFWQRAFGTGTFIPANLAPRLNVVRIR